MRRCPRFTEHDADEKRDGHKNQTISATLFGLYQRALSGERRDDRRRSTATYRCRYCWVMSSPIHISKAVPVVSVSTTTKTVQALNSAGGRSCRPDHRWEQEGERGRLHHGDRDRQVAGPSRDLRWPIAPRCCHCSILGITTEDLHDDRCGDVGHDAERTPRELGERATEKSWTSSGCVPSGWPDREATGPPRHRRRGRERTRQVDRSQ